MMVVIYSYLGRGDRTCFRLCRIIKYNVVTIFSKNWFCYLIFISICLDYLGMRLLVLNLYFAMS